MICAAFLDYASAWRGKQLGMTGDTFNCVVACPFGQWITRICPRQDALSGGTRVRTKPVPVMT